jgi:hypothetical protein
VFLRESTDDSGAAPIRDTGGDNTMGADNETIGSDGRGWGVRVGFVSVMAATGMVLAGQAAEATTAALDSSGTHANGDRAGLPLDLTRLPGGNSGATCVAAVDGVGLTSTQCAAFGGVITNAMCDIPLEQ